MYSTAKDGRLFFDSPLQVGNFTELQASILNFLLSFCALMHYIVGVAWPQYWFQQK